MKNSFGFGSLYILVLSLLLGASSFLFVSNPVEAQQAVCPEGNSWTNHIQWSNNDWFKTYNAPSGYKVVEVCVKGGTKREFYTTDGYKVCWDVDFKNSNTRVEVKEWNCGGQRANQTFHI